MSYLLLKYLHVTCVVLSGLGFFLRGCWMLRDAPVLNNRLVRVLPHVLDTVLLGSALSLAYLSRQYPFAQDWLTAKLCGLLLYILFGSIALRFGRRKLVRGTAFGLALLLYGYVISVASSRNAWPY